MDKKIEDILLYEMRELRREIKDNRIASDKRHDATAEIVTTLKVKYGMIAVLFGIIGSFIPAVFQGHK